MSEAAEQSDVRPGRQVVLAGGDGLDISLRPPLLCPYHNRWGESAYRFGGPFDHCPLSIHVSSTSGSPLVEDAAGRLVGLLDPGSSATGVGKTSGEAEPADSGDPRGVRFTFDGERFSVINGGPAAVELLVGDDPAEAGGYWRQYNRILAERWGEPPAGPDFWQQPEYCTWVEQKHAAGREGGRVTPHQVLDDEFVRRHVDRVLAAGLPPGKLTIDHGWQHGDATYGDWDPHPQRFADLGRTVEFIRSAGFIPGIWLAPIWLHPASRVPRRHPGSLGPAIVASNADSPHAGDWRNWQPTRAMADQMSIVLGRL